jgi:hypothetical protein
MATPINAIVQRIHEERAKALAHIELLNRAVGTGPQNADLTSYRTTLEERVAEADRLLLKWEPLMREERRG